MRAPSVFKLMNQQNEYILSLLQNLLTNKTSNVFACRLLTTQLTV